MKGEGEAPKAGADAPKPAAALLAAPNRDGVEAAPNAGVLAPPTGACKNRAELLAKWGQRLNVERGLPQCSTAKASLATLTEPKLNMAANRLLYRSMLPPVVLTALQALEGAHARARGRLAAEAHRAAVQRWLGCQQQFWLHWLKAW